MSFLIAKTAKEGGKTLEEFEALSKEDQTSMLAFTRVNMKMQAWEMDEQQRELNRKR